MTGHVISCHPTSAAENFADGGLHVRTVLRDATRHGYLLQSPGFDAWSVGYKSGCIAFKTALSLAPSTLTLTLAHQPCFELLCFRPAKEKVAATADSKEAESLLGRTPSSDKLSAGNGVRTGSAADLKAKEFV